MKTINNDNGSLSFVQATKEDLVRKWGKNIKESFLYKMIERNNCNYYLIYKGDKFFDDFWIYLKDTNNNVINDLCVNGININNYCIFDDEKVMNEIFAFLKKDYRKITIILIDNNDLAERHKKALDYGFKHLENDDCEDYHSKVKTKIYEKFL